jgi:hypothetical protein
MKKLIFTSVFIVCCLGLNAQIKVNSGGNIEVEYDAPKNN